MARSNQERDTKLPSRVTSWTNSVHLDLLKVTHVPSAFKDPNDIFDKLNRSMTSKRQIAAIPERMAYVKDFIVEYVNFSIVQEEGILRTDPEITRGCIVQVEECLRKLSNLNILEYMQMKGIHEHDENELELKRFLTKVYVKSQDFLEMVIKFLKMMLLPTRPFKSAYTELIRVFTNMCDFTSVPGDTYRRLLTLQDEAVRCSPDLRYLLETPASMSDHKDVMVVMTSELTRVKQMDYRGREKDFNIENEVDDRVLGQYGGELLVDSPYSFFKPFVLGALCLQTEIIFSILEMDFQHLDKLECNKELTTEKAYIYHTRPYNVMIAEERGTMLDFLLRLSLFQRTTH